MLTTQEEKAFGALSDPNRLLCR